MQIFSQASASPFVISASHQPSQNTVDVKVPDDLIKANTNYMSDRDLNINASARPDSSAVPCRRSVPYIHSELRSTFYRLRGSVIAGTSSLRAWRVGVFKIPKKVINRVSSQKCRCSLCKYNLHLQTSGMFPHMLLLLSIFNFKKKWSKTKLKGFIKGPALLLKFAFLFIRFGSKHRLMCL